MNSRTLHKLKPYLLTAGDSSRAVGLLKSALKSVPSIAVKGLQPNNSFDQNTQKAVATFQAGKKLQPTGRMDVMTWLALGSEMNLARIKNIFTGDRDLRELVGLGCILKNRLRRGNINGLSNNAVIQTRSVKPASFSSGYKFDFLVYISVFAPFDWFGPFGLSMGDGANRHFATKPESSYRLQCSSKVPIISNTEGTYTWETRPNSVITKVSPATTSVLLVPFTVSPSAPSVVSPPFAKTANSPGHLQREEDAADAYTIKSSEIANSPELLKYQLSGNDDAFKLFGDNSWLASDIDVHPDIKFEHQPDQNNPKRILLRALGRITGDQFPCVETFMLDKNNNGVMLGVWQINDGDGPVVLRDGRPGLEFDSQSPMIDIDVTVAVENGLFTGVLKNGRIVSLAEHNQYYLNLPPVRK